MPGRLIRHGHSTLVSKICLDCRGMVFYADSLHLHSCTRFSCAHVLSPDDAPWPLPWNLGPSIWRPRHRKQRDLRTAPRPAELATGHHGLLRLTFADCILRAEPLQIRGTATGGEGVPGDLD